MHRRLKNLSLSKKFILPMIGVVILVMGTTGSWLLDTMYRSIVALETQGRESLLAEKSVIVDTVESSLKAKADILGRFLAKIAPDFILSYDYTSITSFIDMATKDSDVIHVAFLNPQGEKLVGDSMAEKRPGHRFYDFPIEYDGELLGSIRIIMSTQNLDATVQASEGRFNQTIGNFKKEAVTNRKAVFRFMVGGIFAVVLGLSIVQLFLFRRVVKVPLLETHERLQEIARGDGDLTKRVPADSHDEIGQVGKTFNLFVHTLQQMISHVQINADAVMKESQALERLATGMSDSAKIQVDKTLDVRTGIDQIAVTITEVAGSASNVVSYASELDEKATQGAAIVQESVDKMDRIASSVESIARTIDILGQSSEEIQGVVDVINDIADQTNLLSLNASIEAARAGEHGRGFSVVAGEVGKLSERTGNATKEIGDLIRRIQTDIRESVSSTMEGRENVQSGVDCIQEAGLALGHIKSSVSNLSERIKKIAASTEEQSACSEMANTHVGEIADEAEAMNKHAKESLMLGKKVSELSGELNDLVSRFKCLSAES